MWGFLGVAFAGLMIVVGLIGLAFGTAGAVFGVLVALGIVAAIGLAFGLKRGSDRSTKAEEPIVGAQPRNPRSGGAPAMGEGPPQAETAPAPHEPAGTS
jgi:hypothetical protein